MADSYTPNLGLTLMENGTHANTWNDEYLNNDERIDAKIGDVTTINSTGGTQVLTGTQERVNVVKVTGVLVANLTIEFSGIGGAWVVQNDTTGLFTLTCKKTGQTGVTIPQATKGLIYYNGTDIATLTDKTAASLGLGTGDSPQFAGVNVGDPADTTVSRSTPGVIAVEGRRVLTADYGSFFCGRSTNLTIPAATQTQLTWSESVTGGFDTNNEFAAHVWTPKFAGKVAVSTGIYFLSTSSPDILAVFIRKNGTAINSGGVLCETVIGLNLGYAQVSAVIDVNGTTDYIDVSVVSVSGGSVRYDVGGVLAGYKSMSWFAGHYA